MNKYGATDQKPRLSAGPPRNIFGQLSAINPKPLHTLTSDPHEEFLPTTTPLTTYVCASHAIFSAQNGGHKKVARLLPL